ncbi:hypothetical protein K2X30_03825 [bacterium]|nr:hypothetical protein [bacterium]
MARKLACRSNFKFVLLIAVALSFSGCRVQLWDPTWFGLPQKVEEAPAPPSIPEGSKRAAASNAEILSEMYQVIFLVSPKNVPDFGAYLDTLNQGASLEGIYNGFVNSAQYRQFEKQYQGSGGQALKVFSQEMALLEKEFKIPTIFSFEDAKPLASPLYPKGDPSHSSQAEEVRVIEYQKKRLSERTAARKAAAGKAQGAEELEKIFKTASIYTLKRYLASQALRVIRQKSTQANKSPEILAQWYSHWVAHLVKNRKVDFGLELRNRPEEEFHFKWAMEADTDILTWEVLNRVHRLLNVANQNQK